MYISSSVNYIHLTHSVKYHTFVLLIRVIHFRKLQYAWNIYFTYLYKTISHEKYANIGKYEDLAKKCYPKAGLGLHINQIENMKQNLNVQILEKY